MKIEWISQWTGMFLHQIVIIVNMASDVRLMQHLMLNADSEEQRIIAQKKNLYKSPRQAEETSGNVQAKLHQCESL